MTKTRTEIKIDKIKANKNIFLNDNSKKIIILIYFWILWLVIKWPIEILPLKL